MTVEEAVVYLLVSENRGMTTEAIACGINSLGLHIRKDGQPVTSAQVYAACMRNPSTFVKDGRLIRLIM